VLQVKGGSMIEAGIFDGDWVVIEQRDYANN
jgi:repressor LexA